jgi:hypothetical protein
MAMMNAISFESRNNIILWDVQAQSRLATLLPRSTFQIRGLSLSPDGKLLASGSLDAGITLWDVAARRPLRTPLVGPATDSRPVGFLADGGSLLSAGCLRNDDVGRCTQDAVHSWDVSPVTWQARACGVAQRNLTPDEWRRFVSETLPYERTCEDFPAGEDPVAVGLAATGIPPTVEASLEPARAASSPVLAPAATGAAVRATPTGVSTPASQGGPPGVVGSAYISPTYGYGLSWDASLWTVQEEFSENGEDWLELDSGAGFVSLGGYVYDGFGRSPATGCFQDRVAGLEGLPDVTSFVPAQAHQRPVTGGASPGAAGLFAATFSSESGEGDDQVIYYVECRVLGEGDAVLHLTVGAYADGYEAHRQAAEALLATLRLPGQAGATTERQATPALVPARAPTMISGSTPEAS